jgi:hypothetical protein
VIERPHVVNPVGELDENDANIFPHGAEHLAKVLCLLLFAAAKVGPAQFRHTVNQSSNFLAEDALQLIEGGQSVLDRVMQQTTDDAGLIELQVANDACYRERMNEIRLT